MLVNVVFSSHIFSYLKYHGYNRGHLTHSTAALFMDQICFPFVDAVDNEMYSQSLIIREVFSIIMATVYRRVHTAQPAGHM